MGDWTYPPVTPEGTPYTVPAKTPLFSQRSQKVLISNFANGAEQRRLIWNRSRSEMEVKHIGINEEWKDLLENFWYARQGSFDSFNVWFRWSVVGGYWQPWKEPTPYKYRFSEDGFKITSHKDLWWDVEVKLIETNELRN